MNAQRHSLITGQVTDESGQAVPDAIVDAKNPAIERSVSVRTDADGRFRIDTDFRAFFVTASAEDGKLLALEWSSRSNARLSEPLDLRVRPARQLAINVADSEARPVPDARVELVSRLNTIAQATTDQAGHAIISVSPDAELEFVLAMKDRVGLDYRCFWHGAEPRSDPYRLEPDHAGPIDLCLNGASVVKVRVVDDADRGMPGVAVKPWFFLKPKKGDMVNVTSLRSQVRTTDADGVAEFAFIPADCQRPVLFKPHLKGFCAHARCVWDPKSGARELKTAMTAVMPVEGTVVNSDRSPAAGAIVRVGGQGLSLDEFRGKVTTDEHGIFHINVHPEQFYLFAAYKDRDASAAQTRMIRKQYGVEPIQLVLQNGTRVHGRITLGPDRAPASGDLHVSFSLRDDAGYEKLPPGRQFPHLESGRRHIRPTVHDQVSVDAEGQFEFYVGPGKHDLTWWRPASGPIDRKFVVENEKEIELHLHANEIWTEPRTVRGRVVYQEKPDVGVDEATLIGKSVAFENVRGPEGTSDPQGNFHLRRHGVSDFYLLAVAPDGMRGMVLVKDSDEPVTIEVNPAASLRGRVLDEHGAPVAGATLRYGILIGERGWSWYRQFDGEAETSQDGSFTTGGMVPGYDYRLWLEAKPDGRSLKLIGLFKPDVAGTMELGELKLTSALE